MKILKFGGKSLATAYDKVIEIISTKAAERPIAVVVSAVGDTTNLLEQILEKAKNQQEYQTEFSDFKSLAHHREIGCEKEFGILEKIFAGVSLLGDYNLRIKDQTLSQGELISVRLLVHRLQKSGQKAIAIDSRNLFAADDNFGNADINLEVSQRKVQEYFSTLDPDAIPVMTGFIARTEKGETVTLGRNGSNYSAALLADFLDADELQNYTHVDGIFTADPTWVPAAQKIEELHFDDANEMANFGASILHAKTISPLLHKKIPLRILNTSKPTGSGTLISARSSNPGIKSLSVKSDVALVQMDGRGLLGTIGVDARIFSAMATAKVNVGVISQGSSERGIGFIVDSADAEIAVKALQTEFTKDMSVQDVGNISVRKNLAVVSLIGMELQNFDKAFAALVKNKIVPLLFNNAVTGKNVSLVVEQKDAKKAVNVMHGQIFGVSKQINLAIFGHGLVGGTLIDQILTSAEKIEERKNLRLNIFAIGNSKKVLLGSENINLQWRENISKYGEDYTIEKIMLYAEQHHLENLIAIDNTASTKIVESYIPWIQNGFDLISSNKIGNTLPYDFYKKLRKTLKENQKEYLYETNVGAGLPLIDTIKLLHLSGENITRIKGVFSGSLSYVFNTFSSEERPFSEVLRQAIDRGYTEPDPREDLCGNDVGRKLLILARELDLENNFEEIKIQNLIPDNLRDASTSEFLNQLDALDSEFANLKFQLKEGFVLRYVGELSGDLSLSKGILETKLVEAPIQSALGQLKGSDSLFEIYTESYGENPIIIQGAGAGADVTARGVFGDILRLAVK